ncbi:MAG TPA: ATP synthase F1 subunit gamma [Pseudobdellovibrionaceae bacterium]|nr:ATP synthase F1 subunit gamma [Pseudobdellovibrionaceae bacterium]
MPSLKDIRLRIDSTKNTQQITKAMKMVSAAKLRRAQQNIVNMRPYAHTLLGMIADIALTKKIEHALLTRSDDPKKVLVVVITSDRGLCGAFNTNVSKFAERYMKANKEKYEKIDFLLIGRRGADYFRRRGVVGIDTILNMAKDISYEMAAKIAENVMNQYKSGEYDEVRFIYNEFKSAIQQTVVAETMLPIDIEAAATLGKGEGGFPADMIFEPSPEEFIEQLIVKHFNVQVYRCLSESVAAEHGARMTSMENATKNAGEMIKSLTLTYNKARQAAITTELIEITSGAEALKA